MPRTASCLWTVTPALLLAIDAHLGPPVDSYVNGSQTWFTDEPALGDLTLEWRLHPVPKFAAITGLAPDDRFDAVVAALGAPDADPDALRVGPETRSLNSLWDGLECYVAYGDDSEPAPLAHAAAQRLGIAPDVSGLADHDIIGDAWERSHGAVSISALLRAELTG